MKSKCSFLKRVVISPLFISVFFFLLLQLPIFNFGFNYRDEGYLLNNAQRIYGGEIPYVDFALTITPGAFYIQSLIFKLFGNYIITDRIFYVLSVIIILTISSKLFKFSKYLNYISLLFLAVIYTGIGAFASYNMYGVVFIMTTLFLYDKLRNNNKAYLYSFLIGFTNSLTLLTKQTYGFIFFFTILFLLFFSIRPKNLFKNIAYYLIGSLVLPIVIFLIFYANGILSKFIYNIFNFALAVKNDRLPFILTSALFIPFFMFLVNFMKRFTPKKLIITLISLLFFVVIYILIAPTRIPYLVNFYKEPTIYYFLLFFITPLTLITIFFKSKDNNKVNLIIISTEAISLFLASAFSGRDYTSVIVVAPLYIPLFIYLLSIKHKSLILPATNVWITLFLILFTFPSLISLIGGYDKVYGSDSMSKSYRELNIKEARYINIPVDQKIDLENVANYIKSSTPANTKILCVPYCSFMQFLSERRDASYFNFFYKFTPENQSRVIQDLKNSKNTAILIQRPGPIEREALFEDKNISVLKKYIFANYKLAKTTDNFYIYKN